MISDIHITGSTDPFYRSLLSLIETEIGKGDWLVLAGDIFDFFVGKQPRLHAQYEEFFELLRKKGSGEATIHYIEGNHDFHLDSTFRDLPGFHLVKSEIEIQTPKNRIYIAHGDLVDREDHGYRALRVFFRSPFIRLTAFTLPEAAVEWIGTRSSRVSQAIKGDARIDRIRSVFRAFAEAKFKEGFSAIVLGHCHDDHGFDFVDGNRRGSYLNVGFPKAHRSYVVFTDEAGLVRKPLPV